MVAQLLGELLAGLGLFFIGVKILGDNMKELTGRRFRRIVSRVTENRLLAAGWGFISGALLQSSSIVTFIVVSLISAGLIKIKNALPIIIWSNVGGSVLVLVAALDIHLLALYLIGVTGLTFYFDLDKSPRFRHLAGALLGIGMLFLGLDFLKTGASTLNELHIVRQFFQYVQHSYILIFFIAAIFTMIAQSSSTISVVVITMAGAGLLSVQQTIVGMYGASVGSGFSTLFLSSNLKGTAKQAAIFQTLAKVTPIVLLLPAFYLEVYSGLPLVQAYVAASGADLAGQMAIVYVIYQITGSLLVSIFSGFFLNLLGNWVPPTHVEEFSRPQFLLDQALQEPETAFALVEKESLRIIKRLPDYLDRVREVTNQKVNPGLESLHHASRTLMKEIDAFMTDLMDQTASRGALERAIAMRNLNGNIGALEESLYDWVKTTDGKVVSSELMQLMMLFAEGLHVVLLHLGDTVENPEPTNLQFILALTGDRSEMMEEQRRTFLREQSSLSTPDQETLYAMTTIFERIFWIMRRIAIGLNNMYGEKMYGEK